MFAGVVGKIALDSQRANDSWGFIIATGMGVTITTDPPNAGASAHGEWVLVTLTKDANGSATYVDGQRVATGTVSHEYMSNRSTLYLEPIQIMAPTSGTRASLMMYVCTRLP